MSAGKRKPHSRTPRRRTPHRSSEIEEEDDRFSPESYFRSIAQRQSERLRVRRKWRGTVRNPKQPYLSLAERILIAKLDPEHFSVQATRSPEVQQAVCMTPRPSLSELIKQYRRLEALERNLGQSMVDKVKETQNHMKRVEDYVQQPILMQGEDSDAFLYQSESEPPQQDPINADLYQPVSEAPKQELLNAFLSQSASEPLEEPANADSAKFGEKHKEPRQHTEEKISVSQKTLGESTADADNQYFDRNPGKLSGTPTKQQPWPHSTQTRADASRANSREEEERRVAGGDLDQRLDTKESTIQSKQAQTPRSDCNAEVPTHGKVNNPMTVSRETYDNSVDIPVEVHGNVLQTPRKVPDSGSHRGSHSAEANGADNSALTADENQSKDHTQRRGKSAGERGIVHNDKTPVSAENEPSDQCVEGKTNMHVSVQNGQSCHVETITAEASNTDSDKNEVTSNTKAKRTPCNEHVQSTSLPQIPTRSQDSEGENITFISTSSDPISLPSIVSPTKPTAPNISSDRNDNTTKDGGKEQSRKENKSGSKCSDRSHDTNPVLTQKGATSSASDTQQRERSAAGMQSTEHVGRSDNARARREKYRSVHDQERKAHEIDTSETKMNEHSHVSIIVSEANEMGDEASEDDSELSHTNRSETSEQTVHSSEYKIHRNSEPAKMISSRQRVYCRDSHIPEDSPNDGNEVSGEVRLDERRTEQELQVLYDRHEDAPSDRTSHGSNHLDRNERILSGQISHRNAPTGRDERAPSGPSHSSAFADRGERTPSYHISHRSMRHDSSESTLSGQTFQSKLTNSDKRTQSGQTSLRSTLPDRDERTPSGQMSHRNMPPDRGENTPSGQTFKRSTPTDKDGHTPSLRSTSPERDEHTPSGQTFHKNTPSGRDERTQSGQTSHRSAFSNRSERTTSDQTFHGTTSSDRHERIPSGQTSYRSMPPNQYQRTPYGETSPKSTPPVLLNLAIGEDDEEVSGIRQRDKPHPYMSHHTYTPPSHRRHPSSPNTRSTTQETIDSRQSRHKNNEGKSQDSVTARSAQSSPGTQTRRLDKQNGTNRFRSAGVRPGSATADQAYTGTENGPEESRSGSVEASDADSMGTSRLEGVYTPMHIAENIIDQSDVNETSNEKVPTGNAVKEDDSLSDARGQCREQSSHHSKHQNKHRKTHHREGTKEEAVRKGSPKKNGDTLAFKSSPSPTGQNDEERPKSVVSNHSAHRHDNFVVRKHHTRPTESPTGKTKTQSKAMQRHGESRNQQGSRRSTFRHQTQSREEGSKPRQKTSSEPNRRNSTTDPAQPVASDSDSRVYSDEDDECSKNSSLDKDDGNDEDDERIYDFIGMSQQRSYSLPEFVHSRLLAGNSIQPRCRLHRDSYDIHDWIDDPKSKLPTLESLVRSHCFVCKAQPAQTVGRDQRKGRHSQSPTLRFPALNDLPWSRTNSIGKLQNWRSSGHGYVKLPDISLSNGVAGNRNQDAGTEYERHSRIMGLYQELRRLNTCCRAPTTVRVDLSRRTSDLDLCIEWGHRLPGVDSSLRIQYRTRKAQPTKGAKTTGEQILKLPKIETSRDSRRKRFRRNYSHKFIFLDDDVFPQVELRDSGEGFYPDVTWFIQPGVASEQCDGGFSAGRPRSRKDKAWQSLKNKCMPRVHIMRALELKSFAHVPRLRLGCSGEKHTAVRH